MSEYIQVLDYPNLSKEHLEILPNLNVKLQYQDVPTIAPILSHEEKAQFLDVILKCFHPSVTNIETGFKISFLEDDRASSQIRAISPGFQWVKNSQYCLLGILNFIPSLVTSASTSTRASSQELRDQLNQIVEHDSNKNILQIMKAANPNQPSWDSFQYFVHLTQAIAKALTLNITKMHQGILLNYGTFQLEARLTSLTASYSQMLLGLSTKDEVMENAKRTHDIRQQVLEAYQDFLKLSNTKLQAFLKTILPQITFSNVYDYQAFKTALLNGTFGEVFYYQASPVPLACPEIKKMCEDLDHKISNINSFKVTEEQQQKA